MCIICICIPTGSKTSASENEVAQSCPTLCDPVDCSPPGSSAHGILQARLLEWVAISFSRGSSWPRNWIQVSRGRRFNLWATREAQESEVAQSCPTLCDPMDCSLPGFSVDFPGESTGVGCHFLLQGIFLTQGSNPGLLHCRQTLYPLSHQRSPRTLEWVACPFSRRSSQHRNWTWVSCIAGRFFTNWAIREAPTSST